MSNIRGKDTKPEMVVRRHLWAHGIRYRLHSKKLPGRPDIVINRLRTVIFINGCFWHGHNVKHEADGSLANSDCCRLPSTNTSFWINKISRNMARDVANAEALRAQGWRVITLWECDLKPKLREATLANLIKILTPPTAYSTDIPEISVAADNDIAYIKQNDNTDI